MRLKRFGFIGGFLILISLGIIVLNSGIIIAQAECSNNFDCGSGEVCAEQQCCTQYVCEPSECGVTNDLCGGTINCGGCATGESCVEGVCATTGTACTDTDGGTNYLSPGTTSAGEDSNTDFCVGDGNNLTEYYCDDGEIASIGYSCDCIDDGDGGYCKLSGSVGGRSCEAFSSFNIETGGDPANYCSVSWGDFTWTGNHNEVGISMNGVPTGDNRFFCHEADFYECVWNEHHDPALATRVDVGAKVGNYVCNSDRWTVTGLDEEIIDLLESGDIAGLTLIEVPVRSKVENSLITGDTYYCGLDLIWHRVKSTVADISCISNSGLDCVSNVACLSDSECYLDYSCEDLGEDGSFCAYNTGCLEDYECQSNSCVDGYCISISAELIAQRSILTRIWCVVTNLPSFISDGQDSLEYLQCIEDAFGGV